MLSRLLLALILALPAVSAAQADTLIESRAVYQRARQAQLAGRHAHAQALAATIRSYPLYPYLVFDDLRRRLAELPEREVAEFLVREESSLLAARLRKDWLVELARQRQWALYRRDYRAVDDFAARCHAITAGLAAGETDAALAAAVELWSIGEPMPAACDPGFARLAASPLLDDSLIWTRLRLAFAKGHGGLAAYLARQLRDPETRALAASWVRAARDPSAELSQLVAQEPRAHEVLVHALERLAARDVDAARAALHRYAGRMQFSAEESGRIAAALARRAADTGHPDRIALLDAVPAPALDSVVERYRLREAIAVEDWGALQRWTARPPQAEDDALRWKYWQARALTHHGDRQGGQAALRELAGERDYYGFMAADALGLDYVFKSRPIAATMEETSAILALPGLVRAHELDRLHQAADARREWYFELARFDRRQLEVAAVVATEWGWHDGAIAALGQARSYDDLTVRFPLLHTDAAATQARRRGLDPARVMAIIRSESAFAREARSVAGALGLMQLLPGTARETAHRIGLTYTGNAQLFEPHTNIALGTAYLSQVQGRFGGSFVMAAAAYNAGPGRVRQWQGPDCIAAERWIEMIPFAETKAYVRRALFYTAIYQWRMGRKITRLEAMMGAIPARGSSEAADCKL